MNHLNQIHAANARAIADNIPDLLAKGHWVVVEFAGLHVVGCENFSGEGAEGRARAKLAELNASGNSTHGELHAPASEHLGEVRPLAAAHGGGSGGVTRDELAAA